MKNILVALIPLYFLIDKKNINFDIKNFDIKKFDIKKLNIDRDYRNQIELMKNIKGYFPENQQIVLSKAEDVFDVLDKINRIRLEKYDGLIQSPVDLSSIDKKEKILVGIGEYSNGKSKEIISNVVNTKRNIYKTKENIERHKNLSQNKKLGKLDSAISFMNCFKPILRDDMNRKVVKVEKVINTLTSP